MMILITRILIDGGILTAIISSILIGILYFNPRLVLSDYPPDIKAAVPPRTNKELRLGLLLSIPLLIVAIALPLYSVWLLKHQIGGELSFWMSLVTIFGEYFLFSMFDLLVLDIWMFFTWTPKFLILPGTEGMAGYKDWRPHAKSQLIFGNVLLIIVSALLAIIPTYLY
jgi:hypothetical protein